MRHKYPTEAIVVARSPLGEANALVTLLTRDVGLVRARAQSVRRPGAKLASSLATYAESDVVLVRGSEGWRVTGASLSKNWFKSLSRSARERSSRITGLVLRLSPADAADPLLFEILRETFETFGSEPEELFEAIECRAVLRLLSALGLDAGDIPELSQVREARAGLITRINRGIAHSGL